MTTMKPELLAPAGSVEGMKAVIAAGADAVYIGGSRFGARAYADNPDDTALAEALDYAHLRGVRVYLTVNTLLKDSEIAELGDYIGPLYERGLDAVLVQDLGVLRYLKRTFPDLPRHASTQMTVTGPESACFMRDLGVTRVVPARELSLKELKAIHDISGLEVEAFIHGALCCSYSGQCLMSSLIGGRSGNRGRCAQPCRLPYRLNDHSGTLLSLKDLCTIDHLPELLENGVISLKIEGRMKQSAYAAGVVSAYRRYLDRWLAGDDCRVSDEDHKLLYDLYNRQGFTDGYLYRRCDKSMMAVAKDHGSAWHDEAVYEKMTALYDKNEKKVGITGYACAYPGSPMTLCVNSGSTSFSVTDSEETAAARERAATPASLRERLEKTGGTDFVFTDLIVDTDGAFLPVSAVNRLRRQALEGLREALLAPYRRPAPAGAKDDETWDPAFKDSPCRDLSSSEAGAGFQAAVSVETENQFRTLLREGFRGRLYYPLSLLFEKNDPLSAAAAAAAAAREKGCTLYAVLPSIERPDSDVKCRLFIEKDLLNAGFEGFLVRSIESLARLYRLGLAARVITDSSLYVFNQEAAAFLRTLGVRQTTAPAELNRKELLKNPVPGREIPVYGRQILMTTANCLRRTTERCTGRPGLDWLTDRTGRRFPVKYECLFCYNTIYNSVPLSLLSDPMSIRRLGASSVRVMLTTETEEEVRTILKAFEAFLDNRPVKENFEYTRGHFGRGVD